MKKFAFVCYLLFVICLISACFSPWTGTEETTLSIVWGGSSDSRFVQSSDLGGFVYDVTLTGPGTTVLDSFEGVSGASFSVIPGTWTVTVKGYSPAPAGNVLRVMGIEVVEVKAGKNGAQKVAIYTATEVDSWGELYNAINKAENNRSFNSASDPLSPREELIIIKESFSAEDEPGTINIIRPIILIAETPVVINRDSQLLESFFIVNSHRLDLGKPGMTGSLTFDGSMSNGEKTDSLVCVGSGAELVMYRGARIQNNNVDGDGGGVYVKVGGGFTNNGGTVSGNSPFNVYREEWQDGPLTASAFVVTDNETTYNGQQQGVTVNYIGSITTEQAGEIYVYYDGDKTQPKDAGEYEITITTEGGTVYAAVEELEMGKLIINKAPLALRLSGDVLSPIDTITVTASVVSTDTAMISLLVQVPGITLNSTANILSYDGTTGFANPARTLNFSIDVNEDVIQNYEVDSTSLAVGINVYDGQGNNDIDARRIPVNQGNIQRFNEYANTTNGLTRNYKLKENITAANLRTSGEAGNWTPIGSYTGQGGGTLEFTGSFDGMGNTITGLDINTPYSILPTGMFGVIDNTTAVIKNVGLVGVTINGNNAAGGIVGVIKSGTVQNCYVTGNVIGGINTGGIVGSNSGTVQNCCTSVFVNGNAHVGGIAGENSGTVQNCYATESVTGNDCIGGIVGFNGGYSSATIISNCYATGNVEGYNYAGGIVGYNYDGTVQNCVALNEGIETKSPTSPGGLLIGRVAGANASEAGSAELNNNYAYDGMLLNSGTINNGSSSNVHGENVTTSQFSSQNFWQDTMYWDFTDTWEWSTSLPVLKK